MFAARRAVSSRQLLRSQPPRRFGSSHAHAEPVNESLGRSFFVTVGGIVSACAIYRITKSTKESGSESWISGLISKWTPSQETFEQRNAIHTAILEKAAEDKHLLQSQGPQEFYQLKQPDLMNAGAPMNVAPGSQADLSHVVAHYEKQNKEIEEARVARMQDGKVVSIYE
ncbi:hypothetical protein N7468_001986 [Penicillium chermesinum]|uniref:NADH-ubiquinone oxidoreductase 178 kDa subunit n=1 Tax=Penicillium chermesinum TaxID=63820 RepID=A0A9W9PJS8_9EURO|nr:uncharacterized protein N7468_001986 [Penicillium chermesinum]KAJ5247003.1 hypothetical protein N7468_001986 [Penicillium chermesinum]KAJ6145254.1 hypothetical protein N7470_009149 [Penicillium chermesinum]